MKAITSRQAAAISQRELRVRTLVRITTYTDRVLRTGATTYRLADAAVRYDLDGDGIAESWDIGVDRIEGYERAMGHIQTPDSAEALSGSMIVSFANPESGGVALIDRLRTPGALEGAEVEVSLLPITEGEWQSNADAVQVPTGEHSVEFRGVVVAVTGIDRTGFSLELEREAPSLALPVLSGLNVDPRDVGKRPNVIYGQVAKVPLMGIDVGAATTLRATLFKGDAVVQLTDASRFPASGSVVVDDEQIDYSAVSGNDLTGLTRGAAGTTETSHAAGSSISELRSSIAFIAAGHPCLALDALYVRNPATDELIRLDPGDYTVNLADPGTEYPIAGWASVRMTDAQVRGILARFADSLSVTGPEVQTLKIPTHVVANEEGAGVPVPTHPADVDWEDIGVVNTVDTGWVYQTPGPFTYAQGTVAYFPIGYPWTDPAQVVLRYRYRATLNVLADADTGTRVKLKAFGYPGAASANTSRVDAIEWYQPETATGGTQGWEQGSAWYTPPAGTTLSDFEIGQVGSLASQWLGHRIALYGKPVPEAGGSNIFGGGFFGAWDAIFLEVEVERTLAGEFSTQLAARLRVGEGLELYADMRGYTAPAGATEYTVPALSLLENVPDIARHYIAERAGLGHSAIDSASWSVAESRIGVPAHRHGFLEADLVSDPGARDAFPRILASLAFEGRGAITREEGASGPLYRLLVPNINVSGDFEYDATSLPEIDDFEGVAEEGPDVQRRMTRGAVLYALNRSSGRRVSDDDAFEGVLRFDSIASDLSGVSVAEIQAAERRWGPIDSAAIRLVTVVDLSTANDVGSYIVREAIRPSRYFRFAGVPWSYAFAAQLGDTTTARAPWWSAARKVRILSIELRDDGLYDLSTIEVL